MILLSFLFLLFQQVPTASVTIEGASALNRVRWAQAGKEVAVGDSEGRIWIYDVGEVLFLVFSKLRSRKSPPPSLRKDLTLLVVGHLQRIYRLAFSGVPVGSGCQQHVSCKATMQKS